MLRSTLNKITTDVYMSFRAMFVQPKYANLLNKAVIRQAMGEPEPSKGVPVHQAGNPGENSAT